MLWHVVFLLFRVQFSFSADTAATANSAQDTSSAVQSAAVTSSPCYKIDMRSEGCSGHMQCGTEGMSYIFCPSSKFSSTLASSCAFGDAENNDINYIPMSAKTSDHWNVISNILLKYYPYQNFSIGMEFNGFVGLFYERSDGDATLTPYFDITKEVFTSGSALDRYTRIAYMEPWKIHTTTSSSQAYTLCAIDNNITQFSNSKYASIIKNTSSSHIYFLHLQSTLKVGKNNCTGYNGTMVPMSDIVTFNLTQVATIMNTYKLGSPLYVWNSEGLVVEYTPIVNSTITQSDLLSNNYFACMKPEQSATATTYLGCFNYMDSLSKTYFSGPDMHIRYCMILCIGQGLPIAGLKNDTCFCIDEATFNNTATESRNFCNESCPAASHQSCGGSNTISIYDTRKIIFSPSYSSCYDLYKQGFHFSFTSATNNSNIYFGKYLKTCTLETLDDDSNVACPPGYRLYSNNCYKFVTSPETAYQAQLNCMADNADLTTMTSVDDNMIWITIKRYPSLQQYTYWHIGIYKSDSNWTYINGQPMSRKTLASALTNDGDNKCGSVRIAADMEQNNEDSYYYSIRSEECNSSMLPYICKHNPYYLGAVSPSKCSRNIDFRFNTFMISSPLMSVTACQQICLGQSSASVTIVHVVVNKTHCICPSNDEFSGCKFEATPTELTRCNGNMGQFCGGDGYYSVYKIKSERGSMISTHNFEDECNELQDNAVRVPSLYARLSTYDVNKIYKKFCTCKYTFNTVFHFQHSYHIELTSCVTAFLILRFIQYN